MKSLYCGLHKYSHSLEHTQPETEKEVIHHHETYITENEGKKTKSFAKITSK